MKVNKGGKEYFTGGSMIPWWMSGISLYRGDMAMDVVQGTILLDPLTLVKGEILLYFSSITNKTAFY